MNNIPNSARTARAASILLLMLAPVACHRQSSESTGLPATRALPPDVAIQVVPGIPPGVAAGLRPYESFAILVNGAGLAGAPLGDTLSLAPASRRDGQPLPAAALADFQLNGVPEGGWKSFRLFPKFAPGQLLPRKPGSYRFDFVLQSEYGVWACPPLTVSIFATASETALLTEFEQSGASQFLDHPLGARRASEPDAPALPYAALADFVNQHPGTYLLDVIRTRLQSLHLTDINSCGPYTPGPLLAEDRQACAAILGHLD